MFRELANIAGGDKKDDSKQERMFGRDAKIPIGNTINELVEMDFVDYGGAMPHFYTFATLFRDFLYGFTGQRKRKNELQKCSLNRRFLIG